jgi:UDP-N-acetylglucosamine 4,6-dehydratase/5-epimerase
MKHHTCLLTGGTGTFGTAYTISAIKNRWHKKIIVYSRDEYKQIKMFNFLSKFLEQEGVTRRHAPYSLDIGGTRIRFFIGDICDYERLLVATRSVDLVIHAAALKHVPICEYNPMEATKINIGGTTNVVNASGANGVKKLIALSTDKAVDPINIYGASKLCLEKVVLGGRMYHPETAMSVVRYGNIIGSRGSIIHKLLLHQESSISLTDPQMTRFWLTIEDAISLVRTALHSERSGTVFVPKLKSLRIDQLFEVLRPDLDVDIIGPRQGEKIHEKMITEEDLKRTVFDIDSGCYIIDAFLDDASQKNLVKIKSYTSDVVEKFTAKEFYSKIESSMIKTLCGEMQ